MSERILVCAITGGRPRLADRPTFHYLDQLRDAGLDTAWVIREDHVDGYEADTHRIEPYSLDWANRYARTHWRHQVTRFEPNGFHGAFTGREWAMRLGAAGGYDAVIQLDDNVRAIGPLHATHSAHRSMTSIPEMFSLLQDVVFSTNVALCGFQLDSIPAPDEAPIVRPGFPYSVFMERVTATRLPYYGPFEDDIMHALDYGLSPAPITAGVMEVFKYKKISGGTSGMRAKYNASRGLELARRYPKNARLGVGSRTSSVQDTAKGFRHFLNTKGFTPVTITDPERFQTASAEVARIITACLQVSVAMSHEKMTRRSKG